MAMNHKTGSELWQEVRAFRRTQETPARGVFNLVDGDLPNLDATGSRFARIRQSPQSGVPNLDGRKVPSGGEAMVPIRKKQVLAVKRVLQCQNTVGIRYRPDFVDASEAIGCLYFGRPGHLQQRRQHAARIAAPEPETARIVVCRTHSFTDRGNTCRERLLMRKNCGFRAMEKPQNTGAKRLAAVARETEALAVYEERGFFILNHGLGVERMRRVFTGNMNCRRRRTKRPNRQEKGHAEEIRVSGPYI